MQSNEFQTINSKVFFNVADFEDIVAHYYIVKCYISPFDLVCLLVNNVQIQQNGFLMLFQCKYRQRCVHMQ